MECNGAFAVAGHGDSGAGCGRVGVLSGKRTRLKRSLLTKVEGFWLDARSAPGHESPGDDLPWSGRCVLRRKS